MRLRHAVTFLLITTAITLGAAGSAAGAALRLASLAAHSAADPAQPLTPQQIRAAYSLPATGAPGQTIAVLSPFNDPTIETDLAAYSKRFGLPACTTKNRCFRKINQQGEAGPLPVDDPTGGQWISESAIGVEIAHGLCPSCRIVLVEPASPGDFDLAAGADAAAGAGTTVLVTAVTAQETSADTLAAPHFSHPRMAAVAAAGEGGFSGQVDFPASAPSVIAVGGTVLSLHGGHYGGEVAWPDTISGCSSYEQAPSWQAAQAAQATCGKLRVVADISAMSEPGAIVHITGSGTSGGPWFAASGTSLAAPIVAATIGLAGSLGEREAPVLYSREQSDPGAYHDVASGSNAASCIYGDLCRAGPGWDAPTGLGTPFGLAAFLPDGGALSARRPRIALSAPHSVLRFDRRFRARLTIHNDNPFAISGMLVLRRRGSVLASALIRVAPLASSSPEIMIASRYRRLLRHQSLVLTIQGAMHGPAGRAVRIPRAFTAIFP
jgi:hypothetical protein